MSAAAVMTTSSITMPPILRPTALARHISATHKAPDQKNPDYTSYHTLSTPQFRFERLPPELQREIYSHLDYQSLIALSCVNTYLHRTVDPQLLASPEDKFAFVMHAENYFPRHFPVVVQGQERPGNFACYVCFRVRDAAHFDAEQPHSIFVDDVDDAPVEKRIVSSSPTKHASKVSTTPKGGEVKVESGTGTGTGTGTETGVGAVSTPGSGSGLALGLGLGLVPRPRSRKRLVTLRRFCIECGVRCGLHAPGDSIFTKLRQELWVCSCRMVWQKPTCLKCASCGDDCPLRAKGSKS